MTNQMQILKGLTQIVGWSNKLKQFNYSYSKFFAQIVSDVSGKVQVVSRHSCVKYEYPPIDFIIHYIPYII